jgi:hypothetical protein
MVMLQHSLEAVLVLSALCASGCAACCWHTAGPPPAAAIYPLVGPDVEPATGSGSFQGWLGLVFSTFCCCCSCACRSQCWKSLGCTARMACRTVLFSAMMYPCIPAVMTCTGHQQACWSHIDWCIDAHYRLCYMKCHTVIHACAFTPLESQR